MIDVIKFLILNCYLLFFVHASYSSDLDKENKNNKLIEQIALEEFEKYIESSWSSSDKEIFNSYDLDVKLKFALNAQKNHFNKVKEGLQRLNLQNQTFNRMDTSGDGNCLLHSIPHEKSILTQHSEHKDIKQYKNEEAGKMRDDLLKFANTMNTKVSSEHPIKFINENEDDESTVEEEAEEKGINNKDLSINNAQSIAILSNRPVRIWKKEKENNDYKVFAKYEPDEKILENYKKTIKNENEYNEIIGRFKVESESIDIEYSSNHFSLLILQ